MCSCAHQRTYSAVMTRYSDLFLINTLDLWAPLCCLQRLLGRNQHTFLSGNSVSPPTPLCIGWKKRCRGSGRERERRRHVAGRPGAECIDCILCLKTYTESDYGGCLYLISLTFLQEEDASPDDSENWPHLNVRLQGLMIFMSWHVLICLWQQKKYGNM